MDSTDNAPTVSYSFDDLGLTPAYVKRSLEDLGTDQLSMEAAIAANRRMALVAVGCGVLGMGFGLLAVKMSKLVLGNMEQIGHSLLATQSHVGMVQGMVQHPPAAVVVEPSDGPVPDGGVSIGEGYDPGPQSVPEEVRKAVESEPVFNVLDEEL